MRKVAILLFCLAVALPALARAQNNTPHPGVGKCPSGQVVNQLLPNAGPPNGCITTPAGPPGPPGIPGLDLLGSIYGASGSTNTIACQTTATTNQLSCPGGVSDFTAPTATNAGNGVEITGAGPVSPLTPIPSLALTVNGTPGAVSYTYALCTTDPMKAIAGCVTQTTGSGPTKLDIINSITLTFTNNTVPAAGAICYRMIGSGPWQFFPCENESPIVDIGYSTADSWGWPSSPPGGAINQDFFSVITNISGTTITLADNVPTSLGSTTVAHDDTLAIQNAVNGGTAAGIAVRFGAFTYNQNRPVFYNSIAGGPIYTFTAATAHYPALFPLGYILMPSNADLEGAGSGITQLVTSFKSKIVSLGFHTGLAANPFLLSPQPTHYPLNNANIGSSIVTTTTAGDAANFRTCNKAWIWGGPTVAGGNYFPAQLRHPVSADSTTGNILLDEPLIKPVPAGTPGANATIMCIDGQYVENATIHGMTFKNHSAIISNSSAVDHLHMVDVSAPWQSELALWQGGFSRDWTMDRCNFVSLSDEIDIQDDVRFSNGSWEVDGAALNADEGSGEVQFNDSKLTMNELYCPPGVSAMGCGINGTTNLGATLNAPGFRLINNRIACNTNVSSDRENQSCLAIQSGALAGYTIADDYIEGNTITSTAKGGLEASGVINGYFVSNNHLTLNIAGVGFEGLLAKSGVVDSNTIEVNSSASFSLNGSVALVLAPPTGSAIPLSATNNTVQIDGTQNYTGVQVSDPGGAYSSVVTLKHNHMVNLTVGINAVGGAHVPTKALGNDCSSVASCYTPAFFDQLDNNLNISANLAAVDGAFNGNTLSVGAQTGTGSTTSNPNFVERSDFSSHPSTFFSRYTGAGIWSFIANQNQAENSGGTWQQDFLDSGTMNLNWTPNAGSLIVPFSVDSVGDGTFIGATLAIGRVGTGSITQHPAFQAHSDFTSHPSTLRQTYSNSTEWSILFNSNQSENAGGTWAEDVFDTGTFDFDWTPNAGVLGTAASLTSAGVFQALKSVGAAPIALASAACSPEGALARQSNSTAACSSGATATFAGTTHCFIGCNGTSWIQFGF